MANVSFQANQQFGELQNFVILEDQAELLAEQLALLIPNDPNPIAAKSLLVNNEVTEEVSEVISFEDFATELSSFIAVDLATEEFVDELLPFISAGLATADFADSLPAKAGITAISANATPDASAPSALYDQTEAATAATLVNSLKTQVNAILAAMKVVA